MPWSEKKVEYIELIYDLIFVFLIGRNNALMDEVAGGFVTAETLITYLLTSLVILQIWYHTSLFVNRCGENGLAEKLMIFLNMFLLYIMGVCTLNDWGSHYTGYILAWCGILLNLALQYALKARKEEGERKKLLLRHALLLVVEALIAGVTVPIYRVTGYAFGPWAMVFGFAVAPFADREPVDFAHLTERVMLYVVFTFGEMIVTASAYFTDGFGFNTLYFALMSFLVVAGLFFSYGYVYENLLERNRTANGVGYLFLHIFLIVALNNITNALEFMHESAVAPLPKTLFLVVSMLVYFFCLAMTEGWSNRVIPNPVAFNLRFLASAGLFALVMLALHPYRHWAVAATVVFIYLQLWQLLRVGKTTEARG